MEQALTIRTDYDIGQIMGGIYGDGFIALKGAFSRAWVQQLREDVDRLFEAALKVEGGALPRGPQRYYVEIHPERIRGWVDLITHPWVTAVCEAVLGPDYKFIEAGFDVPLPGAMHQPWHRDFFSPPETVTGRHLNSLAFNITTIDITDEMGPFEIAPGTQWDTWDGDPMFPPKELHERYASRAQKKKAQMGDISARSALTVHRGTANRSQFARPVFVLGADAPGATNAIKHDMQFTRAYWESLPEQARKHLGGRVVESLDPIYQAHTIEGLLMGQPADDLYPGA
ncbi:phytanoyl-CoA dioxygenase [Massilia arenosa]|uniref:Phytanoyl-CoA dioxygenase n=1 Tax=Zemynaea arenosa TaxID=2561931 RepID=A0A4Y9RU88_9BURK|nr:phytanoyl-CoA dioxygenase family protein [Massilia arenosa]TFW11356.1 phytanoyl-CoA dioxygenase [Massilia arenosa]